jgi:AraC family transcriptional regulator
VAADRAKPEARVLINPAGPQIGAANAILWGRAKRYHVAEFPGPLSIKSVVRGSGVWGTAEAERVVDTGSYLVLNAGRPYTLTIDAREIVETFCLFFRPGFVEDVHRVEGCDPVALLDEPFAAEQLQDKSTVANGGERLRVEFFETLHGQDALVTPLLKRMYTRVREGTATQEWLEDQFFAVAGAMLRVRGRSGKQAARIPAKKLSTRLELYKRLLRGKDFLDSFHAEELALSEVARAACVSPYHFHRLFREVFGETPNQYLQRKRLERARDLLKSTARGVTEISLDVGFESSTSFSTLFRRTFGYSPRAYRSLSFRSTFGVEKK